MLSSICIQITTLKKPAFLTLLAEVVFFFNLFIFNELPLFLEAA